MGKIRILVISYLPWRDDTSVGNTLSNLFNGLQEKIEFASIFFKGGNPCNRITSRNFYISEIELAKSIITRKKVGKSVNKEANCGTVKKTSGGIYNKAREVRWESMLLAQDLIGLLSEWRSEELYQFIEEFQPDLVFGPLGRVPVANLLMQHIHEKYNIPLVTYAWDDHYSLRKWSLSPFFWLKTFLERKYIKKCVEQCEFLYTITTSMKEEYEKYFHKTCRILYKSYYFDTTPSLKEEVGKPIDIIYMGNIGAGRWQVLADVASVLKKINADKVRSQLKIFTMSPISKKIHAALDIPGTSKLMKPVPNGEVLSTMESADILLHVEPTSEKERLFYRLSFSTKIVDYFYTARCILAVGGDTAAMKYIKDNDAGIVIEQTDSLYTELNKLIDDPERIITYGRKGWDCGVRNHERSMIQSQMYNDLYEVVGSKK